ncbi:hypothetical protein ACI3EY_07930 [Ornithinimicrobium sp. LYQ92]|uniref:hypothetical protein n=1 Tax=Serinicoccus sp. LYQ92 TaxID=3378798 RepID=UPI003854528C
MEIAALIVSIVSAIGGAIAVGVAIKANGSAGRSLIKAEEANRLAEKANEYSDRAEARELERNDVHWECRTESKGVVKFVNEGQDLARNVTIAAGVWDGPRQVRRADEVRPGAGLRFEFRSEAQDREARVYSASSTIGGMPRLYDSTLGQGEFISVRVTWETPKGRPYVWDGRAVYNDLGVEYP